MELAGDQRAAQTGQRPPLRFQNSTQVSWMGNWHPHGKMRIEAPIELKQTTHPIGLAVNSV